MLVDRLGRENYADQYFGACADTAGHVLHVLRVPGGDFDAAAARAAARPGVELRIAFVDAVGSRKALVTLQTRIEAEAESYWRSRGVEIARVSVNNDGSGLRVDTAQAATARDQLVARYGPQVSEVVGVVPRH
ncbi:hypothetical protein [Kitasatospora sp. NPDC050543]|uniref:hypothetical protein n=1 Tax=Kitasatospora sp. NPDC050543 TaxID=3364054 RepID=UPI0037A195E3